MKYVLIVYALASAIAFATYGFDKRAARRGESRVPESRLHLMELAGGWPGALIAMQVFRHKRRKTRFLAVTLAIALLHVAAWGWWLSQHVTWTE